MSCAGGLEDPDRFSTECPDGFDVENEILVPTCGVGGCHSAEDPQASLDLATPNARARIITGLATSSCAGEPLLDADAPTQSVLYRKVAGQTCGARMPSIGPALSPAHVDCIRLWIAGTSTTS